MWQSIGPVEVGAKTVTALSIKLQPGTLRYHSSHWLHLWHMGVSGIVPGKIMESRLYFHRHLWFCPRGGGACSRRGVPALRGCLLPGEVPAPGGLQGNLRGIRSRPTPKGEIERDQVQAHSQGGSWGGSGLAPPTDTAAGGTHPTGMHSCFSIKIRNWKLMLGGECTCIFKIFLKLYFVHSNKWSFV